MITNITKGFQFHADLGSAAAEKIAELREKVRLENAIRRFNGTDKYDCRYYGPHRKTLRVSLYYRLGKNNPNAKTHRKRLRVGYRRVLPEHASYVAVYVSDRYVDLAKPR